MKIQMKPTMFKSIFLMGVIIIALYSFPDAVKAKSDWLEKAKGVLKSFGKSDTLSAEEIASGLKEALRVGTATVVKQLGQSDGFNADPAVHIPIPENLKSVRSALKKVGMSSYMDDLELRLNRAAEKATPKAKKLFYQAITEMTLDDARSIYKGPEDAATRYFKSKMSKPLAKAMHPIVDKSLSEVGAVRSYDKLIGKYRSIPFVPDVKTDLTNHVIKKGMKGIFYYLAREEAAIRRDPAKRTTELLKRVFGSG
jgi:hypothetical protein